MHFSLPGSQIDTAKAVRIEDECQRRAIELRGHGIDRCGPCPRCGGRDRFSINVAKQLWNCRQCQRGGDVISLVAHIDGVGFRQAVRYLGGAQQPVAAPVVRTTPLARHEPSINSEFALRIWDDARPFANSLAEKYLLDTRKLNLNGVDVDDVFRFSPRCHFEGERHPAMITLFRNIKTNAPQCIARTALDAEGRKIKRLTLGPAAGAVAKIDADANVEYGLHISEGVETGLRARELGLRPLWATGGTATMDKFPVLSGIDALTIIADNDANGTGQRAAQVCLHRWLAAGREAQILIPNVAGADAADIEV
ncbi:toprim domain-containing protein [Bradyrhizobium sp. Leo170]|uniref:DUF7146 domain-containing protein n=1 Tax=Bradyrhizobium sp. Leo170 TaxID=1571199 RepID=UPI0013EED5CB|nr:toprim domain-containing protein [Bradyrhizobium sp. Leo170]